MEFRMAVELNFVWALDVERHAIAVDLSAGVGREVATGDDVKTRFERNVALEHETVAEMIGRHP